MQQTVWTRGVWAWLQLGHHPGQVHRLGGSASLYMLKTSITTINGSKIITHNYQDKVIVAY